MKDISLYPILDSQISKKLLVLVLILLVEVFLSSFILVSFKASFIITLIAISAVVITIAPKMGFLLCIIVLPFTGVHILTVAGSKIELIQPLVAFTCAAWFINATINPKIRFKKHPLYVVLMVFIFWIFVTATWSSTYFSGIWGLTKAIWVIALVPFAVNMITSLRDLKVVLWTWCLISVVFSIIVFALGSESFQLLEGRSGGMSDHPNFLGMYLSFSIFLLIGTFNLLESAKQKIIVILSILIDFSALLFTGSRGALFGLMFGLIFMSLGSLRIRFYRIILVLLTIGIVGFTVFSLLPQGKSSGTLLSRYQKALQFSKEGTLVVRGLLWAKTYKMIKDSYGMGIGIGSFEHEMKEYPIFKALMMVHPHNFYMFVMVELGMIGLGIFMILILQLARSLSKALKQLKSAKERAVIWAFSGGLFAFGLHAGIDFTIHDAQLWVFLGLTIAASDTLVRQQDHKK